MPQKFVDWISGKSLPQDACAGVRFTVFGCGDHDWAETFQRIPRLIDAELAAHGAERIHPRGEGDQSGDIDIEFRQWYGGLFDALGHSLGVPTAAPQDVVKGHRYEVELLEPSAQPDTLIAEFGAHPMLVLESRELQQRDGPRPSDRSTRHIVFRVPDGVSYREGDHLAVLPRNSPVVVRRALTRFALPENAHVRIRFNGIGKSFLPVDRPVDLNLLLSGYLALQDPAKRSDIEMLVDYTEVPAEKAALVAFSGDGPDATARYRDEVLTRNSHCSICSRITRRASFHSISSSSSSRRFARAISRFLRHHCSQAMRPASRLELSRGRRARGTASIAASRPGISRESRRERRWSVSSARQAFRFARPRTGGSP
jgi:cytochrome P450/NADPH-cytochrome P450 reductase